MNEYIFECRSNPNIKVTIQAETTDEAYEILGATVNNHDDFYEV